MRLVDTTTLRLASKNDIDLPPYAILSHTWGTDDDEVSFEELQEFSASLLSQTGSRGIFTHSISKKRGFAKIKEAARLAKSENYKYIWIDTCCINKSSSAELSEAINSMFRWYEKAAVCYAYLDDVQYRPGAQDQKFLTRENDDHYDESRLPAIVEALRSSRWFTRGWTLQELIAPANVHFYNSKWHLLGNKLGVRSNLPRPDKFPELISNITGVDVDLLKGSLVLDEFSVARRMRWAARRETTRIEDKAYCLMGIFGVNMPLLYGEGDRAFVRLQEEILKSTDDQSIFAWRCPWDDPLRFQLSGLLSSSPSFFATSGFDPLPRDTSRVSAPFTMTNAGLHIRLYLKPVHPHGDADDDTEERSDEFYGVLNCAPYIAADGQYHNAAILLTSLGGDQFARVSPETIVALPSRELTLHQEGDSYRYIYVKQLPTYGLPDIVVDRTIFQQGFLPSLQIPILLLDIYPAENWNQTSFTLKPTATLPNSVLGAFRYALRHRDRSPGDAVDVFVGLAPGHDGPRRLWCIQQPVQGFPKSYHYLAVTAANFNSSQVIRKGRIAPQDECPYSHLLVKVKTIRAHSRTNILLSFSEIHEPVSVPIYQSMAVGMAELESSLDASMLGHPRSEHEAAIVTAAEISTLEVSWDTSLGFSMLESEHKLLQRKVRVPARGWKGVRLPRNLGGPGPRTHQALERPNFPSLFAVAKDMEIGLEQELSSGEGFDVTTLRLYFSLLLTQACIKNDVEAASELLRSPLSGAMVEVQTRVKPREQEEELPWIGLFRRFRPIHWAAALGNQEVLRVLLHHGADVLSKTGTQLTAIHLAILMRQDTLLQDLIAVLPEDWEDERPDWFGKSDAREPIAHLAASYITTDESKGILERFLRRHSYTKTAYYTNEHYNAYRETPLHRAAAMQNYEAAKAILSIAIASSIDPLDHRDRTPLWHAAAAGSHEIVELLIRHLANPNSADYQGRTPLQVACRGGHAKAVQILLEAGANTSGTIDCFHLALLSGDAETLEIFLKRGENPNRPLVHGDIVIYPILVAVANGWLGCVKVLCQAGSDTGMPPGRDPQIILVDDDSEEGPTLHPNVGVRYWNCVDLASRYGQHQVEKYLAELHEEKLKRELVTTHQSTNNQETAHDNIQVSEDEAQDEAGDGNGDDSVSDLSDADDSEDPAASDDGHHPVMETTNPSAVQGISEPKMVSLFEETSSDEDDEGLESTAAGVASSSENMI